MSKTLLSKTLPTLLGKDPYRITFSWQKAKKKVSQTTKNEFRYDKFRVTRIFLVNHEFSFPNRLIRLSLRKLWNFDIFDVRTGPYTHCGGWSLHSQTHRTIVFPVPSIPFNLRNILNCSTKSGHLSDRSNFRIDFGGLSLKSFNKLKSVVYRQIKNRSISNFFKNY